MRSVVNRLRCRSGSMAMKLRCRPTPYTTKKYASRMTAPNSASMRGAARIKVHRFGGFGLSCASAASRSFLFGSVPAAVTSDCAALLAASTCLVMDFNFGATSRNACGAFWNQSLAGATSWLARAIANTTPPKTTKNAPIQRGTRQLHKRVTSGLAISARKSASSTGTIKSRAAQNEATTTINASRCTARQWDVGNETGALDSDNCVGACGFLPQCVGGGIGAGIGGGFGGRACGDARGRTGTPRGKERPRRRAEDLSADTRRASLVAAAHQVTADRAHRHDAPRGRGRLEGAAKLAPGITRANDRRLAVDLGHLHHFQPVFDAHGAFGATSSVLPSGSGGPGLGAPVADSVEIGCVGGKMIASCRRVASRSAKASALPATCHAYHPIPRLSTSGMNKAHNSDMPVCVRAITIITIIVTQPVPSISAPSSKNTRPRISATRASEMSDSTKRRNELPAVAYSRATPRPASSSALTSCFNRSAASRAGTDQSFERVSFAIR